MQNKIEPAYRHLSKDKVMSFLIQKFKDKIEWGNRYNSNYALSIANLIIEQQISFKAAITVKKRFSELNSTLCKCVISVAQVPNSQGERQVGDRVVVS